MEDHTVVALEYSDVLSQMVQEYYPQYSKKHGCYENVYNMLSVVKELRRYHLQAMFCYITLGGQAVRHVFCIADGTIVEPLQLHWPDSLEELNHIAVIRLLEREQYLDMVNCYGYYDLYEPLLKYEILTLKQNRIKLNPVDLATLTARISDTPHEMCELINRIAAGEWDVLDENYSGPGIGKSRPPRGDVLCCGQPEI